MECSYFFHLYKKKFDNFGFYFLHDINFQKKTKYNFIFSIKIIL